MIGNRISLLLLALLLLLVFVAEAKREVQPLYLNEKPIDFSIQDTEHTHRHLATFELIIVQRNLSIAPIPDPLLVLDKHTAVVFSRTFVRTDGDHITPYTAGYKFTPRCVFPVIVRTTPEYRLKAAKKVGFNLWVVSNYSTEWPTVQSLAEDASVLLIENKPPMRLYSKRAREVHLNNTSALPDGSGIIIAMSDSGLDTSHCAFFHEGYTVPEGSQSVVPINHPVVASYVTAIPGVTDYRCRDGCHGTMTASEAVSRNCGDFVGMATGARIAFYDFSSSETDDYIEMPLVDGPGIRTYYEWVEEVFGIGQASVLSGSWGAYTHGIYDSLTSEMDRIAFEKPTKCIVHSAGNDGDRPTMRYPSAPGLGKNVIAVGAVFGTDPTAVADFSSYGPLPINGRDSPTVYSLGVNEIVAYGYYYPDVGHLQDVSMDGTSASAPIIAALIARHKHSFKMRNGGQDAYCALSYAALLATSKPVERRVQRGTGKVLGTFDTSKSYGVPVFNYIGMEDMGILTNSEREKAYCYQALEPIPEGLSIAATFTDKQSSAYSSVNLINDMDVSVFIDYTMVFSGEDGRNPHERYRHLSQINKDSVIRVVIYESDGLIYENMPYGLYLNTDKLQRMETCGTCTGHDTTVCGQSMYTYCNVTTGKMTSCLPTRNAAISESTKINPCTTSKYNGMTVNGQCIPVTCVTGYYFDASSMQCKCVPGMFKDNNRMCNDQNEYVLILAEEETSPPEATEEAYGETIRLSAVVAFLIVLLTLSIIN